MLVYDVEIEKAIPSIDLITNPELMKEGIEFCKGWGDHTGMGLACVCAYNYKDDKFYSFTKTNLRDFWKLIIRCDKLVGFNSRTFDNKIIATQLTSLGIIEFPDQYLDFKTYDIIEEIRQYTGSLKGYGLEPVCGANVKPEDLKLGKIEKQMHGAYAPINWQRGKQQEVIEYCMNDVDMTKCLLDKIIKEGYLTSPVDQSEIPIMAPKIPKDPNLGLFEDEMFFKT